MVASGGLDNICTIYTLQDEGSQLRAQKSGHSGYLSCCRFLSESDIITSSGDATCMHWDIERSAPLSTFTDHKADVMCVALAGEVAPSLFVSSSCDATAKVWDLRLGKYVMDFTGHESDINSVAMLGNGQTVVTGSDDSSCRIFDMRCAGEIAVLGNDRVVNGITSVAFSKSGRLVFAGYDDYNCLAWDTLSVEKDPAMVLKPHNGKATAHDHRVSCLGVNQTGLALCTGSWDTLLRIWA